MTVKDALHRDRQSGDCRPTTVLTDREGPIDDFGFRFRLVGYQNVLGWGRLDGTCAIWAHRAGAYEILLPIVEDER